MVKESGGPIRGSIAAKILSLAMVLILLMVAVSAYWYYESLNTIKDSAMDDVELEAQNLIERIDSEIFAKMHELVQASADPFMIEAVSASNAEFELMEDPDAYISQIDAEWLATPINETTPLMENLTTSMLALELDARYVEHYREDHGVEAWGRISAINRYGAVMAMTQRSSDYKQNDEDWWAATVAQGHYVSDAGYDSFSGVYAVRIAVAVTDESGAFIGEVMGFANVIDIARLAVTGGRLYESKRVLLTTISGATVFSSDSYIFMEDVSDEDMFQLAVGDMGAFISEDTGRQIMYGYALSDGYLDYEGKDWMILIGYDLEEVLAPANELLARIEWMSLVAASTGILLAMVLSRTITRPIIDFKKTATKIASGEMDKRVAVRSQDEVGDLARTFNLMVDRLQESYERLEEKVDQRTKELAQANEELKREVAERKKYADALELANKKLRFLGHITRHDIRNQLTVMRGWLSIAGETLKGPQDAEIMMRTERAAQTIDALLDFTGEYEKMGAERPEWMSLSKLFRDGAMGLDTYRLNIALDIEGIEILSDQMFSKVFRNLIDNTLRHGEKATRVSVTAHEGPEGLVLAYEDDGVGIDLSNKDKMFQRGFGKHTGLGLYLVKETLDMAGMSIEVKAGPGKGARFEILIPKGKYRSDRDARA